MSTYYLFQDARKCIGCRACEIQCKNNKGLSVGPQPCQVITVGPKMVGEQPRAAYTFIPCYHCERPWCVSACPTGAMQQRTTDGIILVDQEICVGCKACLLACPWGAPQWDSAKGRATKCDYCLTRVEQGQKPACVTVCPTGCLMFGRPEDLPPIRRTRHAQAMAALEEPGLLRP